MFCDLAEASILSERLDPEELREIVRGYQSVSKEVVQRFHGHIAQYLGDGILVYFGYPRAQDEDARRAVQAGLGIVGAVAQLHLPPNGERSVGLAVRVGIHTGDVVTGAVGTAQRREQLALGQTPNIAARLQSLAAPGEVVLSPATHRLTRGFFAFESLGPKEMKGAMKPMEVFRVAAESGVHSRFELAVRHGLTPLAGRREELARLHAAFARTEGGEGQVVQISGDIGIGKSRLVHALAEELAETPHTWWSCPFTTDLRHSDFAAVAAMARRIFGAESVAAEAEQLRCLEAALESSGFPLAETVPLFASFLSLEAGDRYPASKLNPGRQKERVLELLVDLVRRSSEVAPVVFAAEDIHWSDPSSRAFLEHLIRLSAEARLLVILTCRPFFSPPWRPLRLSRLALTRLADDDVAAMTESLAGDPLPRSVLQQIQEKAGGVPLFVEELTRMVLDSSQLHRTHHGWTLIGGRLRMDIPSTLQDLLLARLDGQQEAKETAQLAAVVGREFAFSQMAEVSELAEDVLGNHLGQLVETGLIAPSEAGSTYLFKSSLIQEAAYRSLLKSRRQLYHQKISRLLVDDPEVAADRPEFVAHHLTEGGLWRESVKYWLRAGRLALSRSANTEAITHLGKGLELLEGASASASRDRQELAFLNALGTAWAAARGFGAREAEQAWVRARELCQRLGEPPELALVLNGSWMVRFARGELARALELARQTLDLAEARGDASLLLMAHGSIGATLFYQGHFVLALEHFETGLAQQEGDGSEELIFVADQRVSVLSLSALALWIRGLPEKAAARCRAALDRARGLSHPFSMCYALSFGAWLETYRREEEAVRGHLAELAELDGEQGFSLAEQGDFFLSPLLEARHQAGTRSSLAPSRGTHTGFGLNLGMTSTCCVLAERYLTAGHLEKAEGALHWGFDSLSSTEEHYSEGELYRLSGELVLAAGSDGHREEAESRFRQALVITARQGARAFELRAATSLAKLLAKLGRGGEAGGLLKEVYGRFTEGFDSADLRDARALLETLGSDPGVMPRGATACDVPDAGSIIHRG